MNTKKEFLEIGRIINKRGLKGELKVEHYCDSTDKVLSLQRVYLSAEGENGYRVITAKEYKGYVYLLLDGVDSAETADSLRGKPLYAHRDDIDLDEGDVFISDMIGLPVIDSENGKVYGVLSSVDNYGASDVYAIRREDGSVALMPGNDEFVMSIDLEKGIFVKPIPGIFDDDFEDCGKDGKSGKNDND